MRSRIFPAALVVSAFALISISAASASASDSAEKSGSKKPTEGSAGLTSVSPYQKIILKGQTAFVTGDVEGAIAAFREATQSDSEKLLGFYRLGEAQVASGKLDEALATLQAATEKKGSVNDQGKVLFLKADAIERQAKWQEAKDAWQAYSAFLVANPKAVGYAATAEDRIKLIDRRVADEKAGAEVKARREKRAAELEAQADAAKKKDKGNH